MQSKKLTLCDDLGNSGAIYRADYAGADLEHTMKLLTLLTLSILAFCTLIGCHSNSSLIPQLVDEAKYPPNLFGGELSLRAYVDQNWGTLNRLAESTSSVLQTELESRIADSRLRMDLRLMYAMILANKGNTKGQEFLLRQYNPANDEVLPGLFELLFLGWRFPAFDSGGRNSAQRVDFSWVEDLMLATLADTRPCTFKDISGEKKISVRELAIQYGHFDIILRQRKCLRAIPVLCDFVNYKLADTEFDTAFGSTSPGESVVSSLAQWDDPSIEPVMLAVVQTAIQKRSDVWALKYALDWLVKRDDPLVIEYAVEGLGLDHVYSVLVGSKNTTYLKAIRQKVPELQDGGLEGCVLYRQRTARAHAELILIMGEEKDPVPKLMAFADDAENPQRHFAIYLLKGLQDQRVVPWAAQKTLEETDWFIPFCLIELLGATPGNEAAVALVKLLDAPFDKIKPEEGIHYSSKDYRRAIVEELKKRKLIK